LAFPKASPRRAVYDAAPLALKCHAEAYPRMGALLRVQGFFATKQARRGCKTLTLLCHRATSPVFPQPRLTFAQSFRNKMELCWDLLIYAIKIPPMFRDSMTLRFLVVVTSVLAWLTASNHCVFAASLLKEVAIEHNDIPSGCPMHAKQQPAGPENQNGCGDLPCCKDLRATITPASKLVTNHVFFGALITFFTPALVAPPPRPRRISPLDTGPPGRSSFAELVLHRSILAHAPPVLLS
jgi:hypothetical protein